MEYTSNELEYAEEIQACLADGGEISGRERRILDRLRKTLGISEKRAQEIEAHSLPTQFSENEEEYAEEISACLEEDGIISDRERRILDKLRKSLNISSERAKEIESMVSCASPASYQDSISAQCPNLTPQNTSVKQEVFPLKSYSLEDLIKPALIEKLKVDENGYEVDDEDEWGMEIVKIDWSRLLYSLNQKLGLNITNTEIQSWIGLWGVQGYIRSSEYEYDLKKYVFTLQVSALVDSCIKERWIDKNNIQENQINWNRLASKLMNLYGVTMKRWQITGKGTCAKLGLHKMSENIFGKVRQVNYDIPFYHLSDIVG